MKYAASLAVSLLSLFITAGCHAQPSPSPSPVIGWTLSPGTGATSSWTQSLYIAKVASLTSACPTPGGTTYALEGTVAGNATSFSDSNETPGTVICAIDQESFVSGGQTFYSGYSPASAPFAVPALPTAPGMPAPTVTQAKNDVPKFLQPPQPTMAKNAPPPPLAPKPMLLTAGFLH